MARRSEGEAAETDRETDWLRVPATYVDYYETAYLTELGLVRIAFGESVGREKAPFMRTAVMMPISDVRALVETLGRWVAEHDQNSAAKERK